MVFDLLYWIAYDNKNVPAKIEPKQWREDWDDEDINDEFTSQLKKELAVWFFVISILFGFILKH